MLKNYLKNQTLFKTKTLGFNNVKNNANNHLTSIFILLFCIAHLVLPITSPQTLTTCSAASSIAVLRALFAK